MVTSREPYFENNRRTKPQITQKCFQKENNLKLDLQDLLQREVDLVENGELLPFAQESAN